MPVASNLASIETQKHVNEKENFEFKREYTKDNWLQWREYYLKLGLPDIGPDAPTEFRARNY